MLHAAEENRRLETPCGREAALWQSQVDTCCASPGQIQMCRAAHGSGRRAPSPVPELDPQGKCNPLPEIHFLMGLRALQRTKQSTDQKCRQALFYEFTNCASCWKQGVIYSLTWELGGISETTWKTLTSPQPIPHFADEKTEP